MTKERAIEELKDIKSEYSNRELGELRLMRSEVQALEMAIQALSQEPCEDAVSRQELLKAIDTWDKFGYTETGCFVREPKGDYVPYIHYNDAIKCIKGLPSVTARQSELKPFTEEHHKVYMEGWNDGRKKLLEAMEREIAY